MSYYKRHIFFCLNQRDKGEDACSKHGAQAGFDHCKSRVKGENLSGPGGVRVNKAGATPGYTLVMPLNSTKVHLVDLAGKTLLPGFIDGHSHFISALTAAQQANVYPAPFGPGGSVAGIIAALQKLQRDQNIPPGEVIQAYGYDENALPADHPHWRHARVTVLPHVAAQTDARSASALVAANIAALREGRPLQHVVDRSRAY